MKSIIYSNIVTHCNKFNIVNTEQHGFRDKRSTYTNLLELFNDLTNNIDIGNAVDIITIYFAKAFDSINHNKLLVNLHSYGIVDKTLGWIKKFSKKRSFCVKLNNTKSNNCLSLVLCRKELNLALYFSFCLLKILLIILNLLKLECMRMT